MKFKEIKKKNYVIGGVLLIMISVSIFIFKDSSNKGESLTNQVKNETGHKIKEEVKNVDVPKINMDEGSSESKMKMAEKINKENNITQEDYRNFREGIEKKENEPIKKPNKPNKPNSNIINPEVKPSNNENSVKNNNPEENKNNESENKSEENKKEKVYVEGFGWVEPSESQGKEGTSNGDFNKVVGQMD
ncbi:hypothetical protein RHM33_21540 [Clostridioides difficile]|nr:hypothetical protein [Clostridioides difficile]MDW0108398.1 hypothetical protein [Clostridioides difficile]